MVRESTINERVHCMIEQLEEVHGELSPVVITAERYTLAGRVVEEPLGVVSPLRVRIDQELSAITAHNILGYPILVGVIGGVFGVVFGAGGAMVSVLEELFDVILVPTTEESLSRLLPPIFVRLISEGFLWGGRCRRHDSAPVHHALLHST